MYVFAFLWMYEIYERFMYDMMYAMGNEHGCLTT